LIIFLAGAMKSVLDALQRNGLKRIIFSGLFGLGIYMLYTAPEMLGIVDGRKEQWKTWFYISSYRIHAHFFCLMGLLS